MASLVVQWMHVLHEDSDVHHDPSLPENVDETYFLQVAMHVYLRRIRQNYVICNASCVL